MLCIGIADFYYIEQLQMARTEDHWDREIIVSQSSRVLKSPVILCSENGKLLTFQRCRF